LPAAYEQTRTAPPIYSTCPTGKGHETLSNTAQVQQAKRGFISLDHFSCQNRRETVPAKSKKIKENRAYRVGRRRGEEDTEWTEVSPSNISQVSAYDCTV